MTNRELAERVVDAVRAANPIGTCIAAVDATIRAVEVTAAERVLTEARAADAQRIADLVAENERLRGEHSFAVMEQSRLKDEQQAALRAFRSEFTERRRLEIAKEELRTRAESAERERDEALARGLRIGADIVILRAAALRLVKLAERNKRAREVQDKQMQLCYASPGPNWTQCWEERRASELALDAAARELRGLLGPTE